MPESGPSNTAGEMNVKFRADASPVKAAAAEAKVALGGVGEAGKAAGASVNAGTTTATAGIVGMTKAMGQMRSLIARLFIPILVVKGILDIKNAWDDAKEAANDYAKSLDRIVKEGSDRLADLHRTALQSKVADEFKKQAEDIEAANAKLDEELRKRASLWGNFWQQITGGPSEAELVRLHNLRIRQIEDIAKRRVDDIKAIENERKMNDLLQKRIDLYNTLLRQQQELSQGFGLGNISFASDAAAQNALGGNWSAAAANRLGGR